MKITKITVLLLVTMVVSNCTFAQKPDKPKEEMSKMEAFSSQTGIIIKFVDYNLPKLKLNYGSAETKIRKLIGEDDVNYFYQISKKGQYDTKIASIAYEDLLELIKAMEQLKLSTSTDVSLKPDYLENKFVTDDGFKLGYLINKGKPTWFMVLEKYGSGNTIFVNDPSEIDQALNKAKVKIEELMNSN